MMDLMLRVDPRDVLWIYMYRRRRDVTHNNQVLGLQIGTKKQGVANAFTGRNNRSFNVGHLAHMVVEARVLQASDIFKQLHDLAWEMESGRLPPDEAKALQERKASSRGRPPKRSPKADGDGDGGQDYYVSERLLPAAERGRKKRKALSEPPPRSGSRSRGANPR